MPRPRLDETTVEAIERIADEDMEMDASSFDVDTQLRFVLHRVASNRAGHDRNHPLKRVADMTEEFDV